MTLSLTVRESHVQMVRYAYSLPYSISECVGDPVGLGILKTVGCGRGL